MPSNAGANIGESSSLSISLSLRLSCDRCRIQKLKCSVPAGSRACQRCTRARVSCIFGRRTPSKRTNRRVDQTPIPPAPASPESPATPLSTSSALAAAAAVAAAIPPCLPPTPEKQLEGPIDSEPAPPVAPDLEPGSYDAQAAWDSPTLWLHGLMPNIPSMSECDSDMTGYDWLQPIAVDDGNPFEVGKSDLELWPQLTTLTAAANRPTDNICIATVSETASSIKSSETVLNSIESGNTVLAHQRLIVLVLEIQQQLRKLKGSLWHTDGVYSLDNYPIGTILELSQQFSAIAALILRSTASNGGLEEGGDDDDENEKTSSAAADTPTMLLVMCGYMWLVRTYGVVLGHFQKHLSSMPTSHPYGTMGGTPNPGGMINPICGINSTAPAGPALRLGQLPCADVVLSLQQIHTAVGMLLDALQDIEGHLGSGAAVARVMALTSLLNSGKCQDANYGGLTKKATALKELLREKMGL
ncbi:hypothetical protein OIDMADRAFT_36232 [Oidiodendron maius Zn]|uniref:Zn(2)-C6 fungal-type domain-containing protein n=1 Tax=Oidiodendron maius (strain Zn) TaxID=913774 RepID=A0A0C3G9L2_OIDMZ|nr:hypothetical protein OIDMADRAFT_36232 [Oidiodendron maius Zn]